MKHLYPIKKTLHRASIGLLCGWFALLTAGCTKISYEGVSYCSVMQKKSLSISIKPDGSATLNFSTDSDPVVELAREVSALAKMVTTPAP